MNATHDILHFTRDIRHPVESIWRAYAHVDDRSQWSVPQGERMIYDTSEFTRGGIDSYRCGPPNDLSAQGTVHYHLVDEPNRWTYSESIHSGEHLLAVSLVTWELQPLDHRGTRITIVNHVTSLIGQEMIEGTRNGHNKALDQLAQWLG